MKKLFFTIIILFISSSALSESRKKILVSIPPIASITKILVGDLYDVGLIQNKSACPHHYNLKPSQHKLIKEADIIIYINDSFESSIASIAANTNNKKIILSRLEGINLDSNFHIWLSIDNLKLILQGLYNIFLQDSKENEKVILTQNYNLALEKLENIRPKKIEKKIVFIGHSLQHLINDISTDNLYIKKISSLKATTDAQRQIAFLSPKCIIHDSSVGIRSIKPLYSGNLISLDIENWGKISNLENFIIEYLSKIYAKVIDCEEN
jgi:zinc transport system substrate-binding protein